MPTDVSNRMQRYNKKLKVPSLMFKSFKDFFLFEKNFHVSSLIFHLFCKFADN